MPDSRILGLSTATLSILLALGTASATPIELRARVVYVLGDRVYVASAESLGIDQRDLFTFRVGGKEIATGTVIDTRDPAMTLASVTSGSLRTQKKLEKIRIYWERPALRPLSSLRVGCPSPSRACLLFACQEATIGASLPQGAYRADTLSQRSFRFVRDAAVTLAAPWPDTLLVRAFDESADEEIALERGELDVAVFWPGELSTHIREGARWNPPLYGVRAWGSVFAADQIDAGRAQGALRTLNRAIFADDLAPVGRSGNGSAGAPPATGDAAVVPWLVIDDSLPGFAAIQRALGRVSGTSATSDHPVKIIYAHVPVEDRGPSFDAGVATFLSSIRCPVVSDPRVRGTLRAIGPNAFADLIGCGDDGTAR